MQMDRINRIFQDLQGIQKTAFEAILRNPVNPVHS
jgi:hypothetical protein